MTPAADDGMVDGLVQPAFAKAVSELLVLAVACDVPDHIDIVGRSDGRRGFRCQPQMNRCSAYDPRTR
jgi:hypothetical protein